MKLCHWLFAVFFMPFALLAHLHEPSINFEINPLSIDESSFQLRQQSTFVGQDDNFVLASFSVKPRIDKKFHLDFGIGYRQFFNSVGFGVNCFGSVVNYAGFCTFQYNPGVEVFWNDFQLSLNQYIPLSSVKNYRGSRLEFSKLSEVSLDYKISPKHEISLSPFFNHATKRFGLKSSIGMLAFDNLEFRFSPYLEKGNQGVLFSIGISFGKSKDQRFRSFRKQEGFHYNKSIIPIKPIVPVEKPPAPAKDEPAQPHPFLPC